MSFLCSLLPRSQGWWLGLLLLACAPALLLLRPPTGLASARFHADRSLAHVLPGDLHLDRTLGPWSEMAALAAGTFVSEDLTCITAGLLAHDGQMALWVAVTGCLLGIYLSDLGLWLVGRLLGRRVLAWPWLKNHLSESRLDQLGQWFDRRGWIAIFAARFLPGTRLPLYVAAGSLGRSGLWFALWTFIAALVWTPLIVVSVALGGEMLVEPFAAVLGPGWLAVAVAAGALFVTVRVAITAGTRAGRARLIARVSRLWRWEFWPTWLFYLPVVPWLAYLSFRYRGITTWTAANPGIPQGGVVGESKHAILTQLPTDWVVPSLLIPPGTLEDRVGLLHEALRQNGWPVPLICKPDAAQRGAGVKRVDNLIDAEKYLRQQPAAVLVQTYHPGPNEAGIFYYRIPGEPTGRIFSITDKVFPAVIGDGISTLEELIWQHPRYRMQARTFLARHASVKGQVVAAGERFPLALAGNHCQGTMFRDGSHLITPELERAVDRIACQFDGFFIGRFDVRYTDVQAFKAGKDFAIVELNGVTSESTNIYDPSWSILAAYRTLFRQWRLLYRIGHANRQRGHEPTPLLTLFRLVRAYYRTVRVEPLSD